jgi:hypothetical protein
MRRFGSERFSVDRFSVVAAAQAKVGDAADRVADRANRTIAEDHIETVAVGAAEAVKHFPNTTPLAPRKSGQSPVNGYTYRLTPAPYTLGVESLQPTTGTSGAMTRISTRRFFWRS